MYEKLLRPFLLILDDLVMFKVIFSPLYSDKFIKINPVRYDTIMIMYSDFNEGH